MLAGRVVDQNEFEYIKKARIIRDKQMYINPYVLQIEALREVDNFTIRFETRGDAEMYLFNQVEKWDFHSKSDFVTRYALNCEDIIGLWI